MRTSRTGRAGAALLACALMIVSDAVAAPPTWPSAYVVWQDPFEGSGIHDMWEDHGDGRISVGSSAARNGSGGLEVDVSGEDQSYLQRYNLTGWPHLEFPRDTYFSFSFHPNGVSIPDGQSVSLLRMRDGDWNVMAGIRLVQEAGAYAVALELPDGSTDAEMLTVTDGWHTIVLGCRMHDWIGLWVDDDQERVVEGVSHEADFVQVLLLGKADGTWSGGTPSGTLYMDDAALLFAAYTDLWVDAGSGSDLNEGDAPDVPLATLSAAAVLTSPGTTIHVAPGDYRESLVMPVDGEQDAPIRIEATSGRNTVRIMGSHAADEVAWTRLTDPDEIDLPSSVDVTSDTIWKANVSAWGLEEAPRFVLRTLPDGTLERLPHAREPDWHVETEWKHHELWWTAEGGSAVTTCDPAADPDCDRDERSDDTLIDMNDDTSPPGVEPGSLGDVTGAIMFVKDNWSGHYTFKRRVSATPSTGRVTLEALPEAYTTGCWFDHDPSNPALGWHSKYFLEGLPKFMDTPGEWVFDAATQTLYVWSPDGGSPDTLGVEISARETGVTLSHRSHIELVDLDVLLFEHEDIRISNSGSEDDRSHSILLAGLDLGWSTRGLHLAHGPEPSTPEGSQIRHLTLRDSSIHDMESLAIFHWGGSGEDFVRPGITDVMIWHNELWNIGFRDNEQGAVGMSFGFADHMLFEGNHVHHIAHNGVHFSRGKTSSDRTFDIPAEDILTGDILVRGNLFEQCVQNATDAGGLKFWGANSNRTHVFRDVLVTQNVSRNNIGWAWVSETRDNWTYHGKGGMGYYIDYASGIHFFRNIAYSNGLAGFMASGSWMDNSVVLANNTIADSPLGYTMGVRNPFSDSAVGLDVINTIFLHLDRFAFSFGDERIVEGNASIDHDLFHLCGFEDWPSHTPGIMAGHVDSTGYRELPTLDEVRALGFEESG
ncbi:MAG: right-handed parallel beta-helix repeat-containing protein, partial [Deltaproteobacteria bacterium]|nr:right-handed parallel beta-helix repeat-containing protein [Deltaproteobacteria bacterium]